MVKTRICHWGRFVQAHMYCSYVNTFSLPDLTTLQEDTIPGVSIADIYALQDYLLTYNLKLCTSFLCILIYCSTDCAILADEIYKDLYLGNY